MKKYHSSPLPPVLLGLGLGVLRAAEQRLAYEPGTGLLIPGHPLVWVFWLLLAAAAVPELLAARPWARETAQLGDLRLAAPGDLPVMGLTAAGLLVLGSGVADLLFWLKLDPLDSVWRTFLLPKTVLAFPAGAALVALALTVKRRQSLTTRQLALLLPVFWAGLWAVYLLWYCSPDPVADSYLPQVLAVLAAGLSFSQLAGFAYQDAFPRRTQLLLRLGGMLATLCAVSAVGAALLTGSAAAVTDAVLGNLALVGVAAAELSCDYALARTPEQGDAPLPPKREKRSRGDGEARP